MESTGGAWPVCNVTADRRRGRELYRYFRPEDWADSQPGKSGTPSSPNLALTALAQLTALRLNAQRAIISLIDKETMYLVAEATKSTYLDKTDTLDPDGNGLWVGCAAIPKEGRLCEWTLALAPKVDGIPLFFVGDMSKDERFNQMEFVTGPPHFKVYAGTPLTTSRGISIGSLYILDDEPRDSISRDQQDFLGTMSSAIISHLEIQREAAVGRRMNRFNQGLNSFVDGKSTTISRQAGPDYSFEPPILSPVSPSGPQVFDSPSRNSNANDTRSSSPNLGAPSSDTPEQPSKSSAQEKQDPLAPGHLSTFARAANLIRECLDIDDGGGVAFFEVNKGFLRGHSSNRRGSTFVATSDESIFNEDLDESNGPSRTPLSTLNSFTSSTHSSERSPPKILALSTADDPLSRTPGTDKLNHIGDSFLQELVVRYPKGKMWVFDEMGFLSSSEDDPTSPGATFPKSKKSQQKQRESSTMLQHFPGARQLLFVPLWDAASSQWFSGCICWNTLETQVFTVDVELTFISSFGKSVMAECSLLDTILADQQKGDFIGSVSHELRSPLHGILASTEFLSETTIDSYQRSLTDTIDACGRTLLDTINHVLDFSKINSFERNFFGKKDKTPKSRLRGSSDNSGMIPKIPQGAPPLLNIYAEVDLVAITEEVIEGVFAGQMFNYSGHDITDVSARASGRKGRGDDKSSTDDDLVAVDEAHLGRKVETILDVTKGNWIFMTQPGALRRIVMNVFGNAIKYTEQGTIRVVLRAEPLLAAVPPHAVEDAPDLGHMVIITISDTGKGISPDFLRSKLYTPFAQENSLIPGTGLGLSIVRGIVTMLGGSIDIRSEVGRGTSVKVSLPLVRPTRKETPTSASTSMSVNTSTRDDSIDVLCHEFRGRPIAICPTNVNKNLPASTGPTEAQKCLSQYITGWFNLPVAKWSPSVNADVVLVDETCLSTILKSETVSRDSTAILVLCANAQGARRKAKCEGIDANRVIEFLAKPCGPYKLARALRACLGNVDLMRMGEVPDPKGLSSMDSESTLAPANDETRNGIDSLDLGGPGIQVNGIAMADENSANARKAFRTPLDLEPGAEFPFPDVSSISPYTRSSPLNHSTEHRRQRLGPDSTEPGSVSATPTVWKAPVKPLRRIPRILLVDDNKINLRLLETFMRKRKYELVDSADDGKMAVDAFIGSPDGYDIIFMDISMPIMNGFEATQAIRELELQREIENEGKAQPRAMIIALTGLASGRDQSNAFASGFDLYVTKPASFKEVAKLLDNWETNTD